MQFGHRIIESPDMFRCPSLSMLIVHGKHVRKGYVVVDGILVPW